MRQQVLLVPQPALGPAVDKIPTDLLQTMHDYYRTWNQAIQVENQDILQTYFNQEDQSGWNYYSQQAERWRNLNRERFVRLLDQRTTVEFGLMDMEDGAELNLAAVKTTSTRYRQGGRPLTQYLSQRLNLTWTKQRGRWVIKVVNPELDGQPWPRQPCELAIDLQLLARRGAPAAAGQYNRQRAVDYAARWWNGFNPQYQHFSVDCTNFISQCLRAGGAPMTHIGQRWRGWWYLGSGERWSYSWAVAHALRWYLGSSKTGLRATEVGQANELQLGDVISYDFNGDGKWQHSTIVVDFDGNGQPLVAAHTVAAYRRYWSYQDSPAWTPNIQYKFWHLPDRF